MELRSVLFVDADDPGLIDRAAVESWTHGERPGHGVPGSTGASAPGGLARITPLEMMLAAWLMARDECRVPEIRTSRAYTV